MVLLQIPGTSPLLTAVSGTLKRKTMGCVIPVFPYMTHPSPHSIHSQEVCQYILPCMTSVSGMAGEGSEGGGGEEGMIPRTYTRALAHAVTSPLTYWSGHANLALYCSYPSQWHDGDAAQLCTGLGVIK